METMTIDDHPRVRLAREQLAPLVAKRDALRDEDGRAFRAVSPYGPGETDGLSVGDRLRLRARHEDIRLQRMAAEADVIDAERVVDEARHAASREWLAQIDERRRAAVKALDGALAAAARANEAVLALDERAQMAVPGTVRAAWSELLAENETSASRLECWRRAMRESGLLA